MVITSLFGCFTDEETILPLPPYTETIVQYRPENGQVFYSLKNRSVVKQNSAETWDFAFSCKADDYTILLNSSRGMGSYNTSSKDFNAPFKVMEYPWSYDHPAGSNTGSSIGVWGDFTFDNPQSFGNVYLINLGVDLVGHNTGLVKMIINRFENNTYNVKIGDLDGKFEETYTIEKNDSFNFVYLDIVKNKVRNLEPPKNDWDILFTSYVAHKTPYSSSLFYSVSNELELVDGIVLNPFSREIAQDSISSIDDLDFLAVEALTYTDSLNLIGSNWHRWNSDSKKFEIANQNTFVIRDFDKNYYVLRLDKFRKPWPTRNETTFTFKSL